MPGRDVAVIVIVDTPLCRYFSPALTSFRPPLESLGRRLAEMLLASMPAYAGAEGVHIIREVWPMELIPRESDGAMILPREAVRKAGEGDCANDGGAGAAREFRESRDAPPLPPWWGRALSLGEPKANLEKEGEGDTLIKSTTSLPVSAGTPSPFRPKRLSRFATSGAKGGSPPPPKGRGRPRV
jgi:hypothetical protein